MFITHDAVIANQVRITQQASSGCQVTADSGATILFIARYRKEKTGSLAEGVLGEVRNGLARPTAPDNRRQRF